MQNLQYVLNQTLPVTVQDGMKECGLLWLVGASAAEPGPSQNQEFF